MSLVTCECLRCFFVLIFSLTNIYTGYWRRLVRVKLWNGDRYVSCTVQLIIIHTISLYHHHIIHTAQHRTTYTTLNHTLSLQPSQYIAYYRERYICIVVVLLCDVRVYRLAQRKKAGILNWRHNYFRKSNNILNNISYVWNSGLRREKKHLIIAFAKLFYFLHAKPGLTSFANTWDLWNRRIRETFS
jgi:hypothetical protein